MHMILPDVGEQTGMRIFTRCKHETDRIERKISRFNSQSDLSRLNKAAFEKYALVDEEFFDILLACEEAWKITRGAFDPAAKASDAGRAVSSGMEPVIMNPKAPSGMETVQLNRENRTVRFTSPDTSIDLGGFGKGYALEKIKEYLEAVSLSSAFLSFGGSSVLTLGEHPAGGAWKIGIQDYLNPSESLFEFQASDGSVSTSGNFYMKDDGELIPHVHIIDPKTGELQQDKKTMSVQSDSPLLSEIMSTALLVAEESVIEEIMRLYPGMRAMKAEYINDQKIITEWGFCKIASRTKNEQEF